MTEIPTPSTALERVARGNLCNGCGGCAAAAPGKITMKTSAEGFNRPAQEVSLTTDEEERIAAICPGLSMTLTAGKRRDDPLWGPLIAVRTGYATDPALRYAASSGGALSAILIHLLETGAVDFVLQNAADPDNPLANRTVTSRTAEDVHAAAGSRYAPSSPLADIEKYLAAGDRFAVVGKPCDIAALRALARHDARIGACIPFMISFFCAGVPSLKGAEEILDRLDASPNEITAFRYRGHGWPGRATAFLANGQSRQMSYHDSWGGILSRHVQFRCKICPDGTGNFADLVCADAWHCDEDGYPLFEEADGISLIATRTDVGEKLARAALAAGRISAQPLLSDQIAAMQPGQRGRKTALAARLAALSLLLRRRPAFRGFHLLRSATQASPGSLLRNFLGTARRILLNRY